MTGFRYKAFISYSWTDAKWGKWLHHALETYRPPKNLVGSEGRHGEVPERLHPIFKDREEEAAGSSIGAAVEAALASSEFLIVVCSPSSARSEWVDHEIAWFKANRDPDKILALIVDGEPGAAEAECFPKALTHQVDASGAVTDRFVDAPLAADARDTGDGKRGAKLKLAAAMLGVGLDGLVRRDERRRTIRTRIVVTASLALALVMSGLAWFAIEQRDEADRQRAEADGLIEFMLTDLRDKLEPVGRLDALDVVGERALDYYAAQKLGSLDADSLGRRSRALHLVGEIRNIRGDSEAGLLAFEQAAATTGELLARNPDNTQRIYDHAQSVFWVGYIAYERGETKAAEAQFREYKRLADRLVALEPDNSEWQLESSYAETNLGVMLYQERRFDDAEPAFKRGLARINAVADIEGYDAARQIEIGMTLNWLGKVQSQIGKIKAALDSFESERDIYRNVLKQDPANTAAKYREAIVLQHIGGELLARGDLAGSIRAFEQSIGVIADLRKIEPDNAEWQETDVRGRLWQAENFVYAGRYPESGKMIDQASALLARMVEADPTNMIWSKELQGLTKSHELILALASDDVEGMDQSSRESVALIRSSEMADEDVTAATLLLLSGDAQARLGRSEQARALWMQSQKLMPDIVSAQPLRFLVLKRLGDAEKASAVRAELDKRGYRHPAYLRET